MRFFKQRTPSPSSFEKILDKLSTQIRKSEIRAHSLRYAVRRIVSLITIYALLGYISLVAYVVVFKKFADPLFVVGSIGVPFLTWVMRKLVQIVYGRMISRQENKLEELKESRKAKIEELKSSTKYYSTKSLLDRFDAEGADDFNEELEEQRRGRAEGRQIPGEAMLLEGGMNPTVLKPAYCFGQADSIKQLESLDAYRYGQSTWYDKLFDLLAGEDERSPRNRYALICSNCLSHNGLAPPGQEPKDVVYMCPRCGTWNPLKGASTKTETTETTNIALERESETEEIIIPEPDTEHIIIPEPTPQESDSIERLISSSANHATPDTTARQARKQPRRRTTGAKVAPITDDSE
ncbi:uncharacterized protein V1518DRAFT_412083 [Limtongia smithiae]|uniref:uncharacterized protein n=1 Tax=Limtongia smithiae TaxID=1125753 RepID=UPI0034CFE63D